MQGRHRHVYIAILGTDDDKGMLYRICSRKSIQYVAQHRFAGYLHTLFRDFFTHAGADTGSRDQGEIMG